MGSVWRLVSSAGFFFAVLAAVGSSAAAAPEPPVKIEVFPEYRTLYEGAFLVLRDAQPCRLPDGVVSTGDHSRGIRVTIDGLKRYETGTPQLGGNATWTRIYYGDPDDLIVRFHGGKSEGDYTVVIECRVEQRKWTKVAEKSFPAMVPMRSSVLPVVPVENPVLDSGYLFLPCNSPCRPGDEGHHDLVMNGQRLTERAADVKKLRAVRQFKLPPGLRPGIQFLEIGFRDKDGSPQGQRITVPVITRFDENGAAKDVPEGPRSAGGGGPDNRSGWTWSVPLVLGGAVLLLIAVRRARRRL